MQPPVRARVRRTPAVLAVDLGTSGMKLALVTTHGEVLASDFRAVATRTEPGGGATQDAEGWWSDVIEMSRDLLRAGPVDPADVVAVGCTAQWGSSVPVDQDIRPVTDCLTWMDGRGAPWSRQVLGGVRPWPRIVGVGAATLQRWLRITGGVPTPRGRDPLGHRLYLQHEQPEVWERTRWVLEPVDYLTARFTGRASATAASMLLSWLTDNRDPDTTTYDGSLVAAACADRHRLPNLLGLGSTVGTVRRDVAERIGLTTAVPVVTGIPDLHSTAYGVGCLDDLAGHLVLGTTSWISAPVPYKRTDLVRMMASVPGATPGRYLIANSQETAGACLQWLREGILADPVTAEPPAYEALLAEADRAPAGSGGVIFQPWLRGERVPVDDASVRGGFANLSIATRRPHLVRAVLEGVAYNTRWMLDAVEAFLAGPVAGNLPLLAGGRRLPSLRLAGGGARSDLWCQIHADVLGVPLERIADPLHVNVSGAAIFAAVSLGLVRPAQVGGLIAVDRVFRPDPGRAATYDRLRRELPGLYRRNRAMYARLNGETDGEV